MLLSPSIQLQDANNSISPKTNAGEISIVTPENKTYYEPMSGYYPATLGFESDNAGDDPLLCNVEETGGEINVVDSIDGHNKVVAVIDNIDADWPYFYNTFDTPQTYGTYEYWVMTTNGTGFQGLRLYSGSIIDSNVGIDFVIYYDSFMYYYGSSWHNITSCANNRWYHIEIAFECTTGGYRGISQYKFKVWIDNTEYGECGWWHTKSSADSVQFMGGGLTQTLYIDAIGYSWDSDYNIGDNKDEGLLLSYENATPLDWQGYSLDNQANKTILGNTTIPMPVDGGHNIQVFGNDTMGTMYASDLRYFTVNTAPPDITINSPTDSQIISSTAPSYDISIAGPYDSIWYALEGGTNYTATGLTGTIDQSAWSALSDEIITINFYANNSAGMEGTAQVMVVKDSSEEPPPAPPGIPGYDLYLFIGALCVISTLLIRKRVKS